MTEEKKVKKGILDYLYSTQTSHINFSYAP